MARTKKHREDWKEARKKILTTIHGLEGNLSQSKIARKSGVSRKTVYKHLDSMREEGLIYRSEITGEEKVKAVFPLMPSPTLILSNFIDNNTRRYHADGFLNKIGIHFIEMPGRYLKEDTVAQIRRLITKDIEGKGMPENGEILLAFFVNKKQKSDTVVISPGDMDEQRRKEIIEGFNKIAPKIVRKYETLENIRKKLNSPAKRQLER
jgi:DNA-binding transcriptional ArsR family regulator